MTSPTGSSEVATVRASGGLTYPVYVEAGVRHRISGLLARHAPAFRYAVVSDGNVAELHGGPLVEALRADGLAAELFSFPAGEAYKIRKSWSRLSDELFQSGFGRDSCIIALGGGVTGDLAGFVAATFMRGVPVVQVPTSLVAMVDASVGGKTGVDVKAGKNLVGAFHPPRFVAADPEYATTLPRRERSQGLAEAVKHGAILDEAYFEGLKSAAGDLLAGVAGETGEMVHRSVALKAGVVSEDEREGGLRKILNFGHTLGHALEAESDYALSHGTAVAIGMVLEARVGERLGVTQAGSSSRLASALEACELETARPVGLDPEAILDRTRTDKKTRGGEAAYVLLTSIGEVDRGSGWTHSVPDELVREILRESG